MIVGKAHIVASMGVTILASLLKVLEVLQRIGWALGYAFAFVDEHTCFGASFAVSVVATFDEVFQCLFLIAKHRVAVHGVDAHSVAPLSMVVLARLFVIDDGLRWLVQVHMEIAQLNATVHNSPLACLAQILLALGDVSLSCDPQNIVSTQITTASRIAQEACFVEVVFSLGAIALAFDALAKKLIACVAITSENATIIGHPHHSAGFCIVFFACCDAVFHHPCMQGREQYDCQQYASQWFSFVGFARDKTFATIMAEKNFKKFQTPLVGRF